MGYWKTVETLRDKAFWGKCSLGPCPGRVCFNSIPFLPLFVSWALWGEQVFSTTCSWLWCSDPTQEQRLWREWPWPKGPKTMSPHGILPPLGCWFSGVFCHGNRELTTLPRSSQFCQKTHLFSFKQDVSKWLLRKWRLLLYALVENRKSAAFIRKRNTKQLLIPNGVIVP